MGSGVSLRRCAMLIPVRASRLSASSSHRRRVSRQREALAGVRHRRTVDLEDGQVLIEVVADVEKSAVGAEDHALGQPPTSTSASLVTFLPSSLSTMTLPLRLRCSPRTRCTVPLPTPDELGPPVVTQEPGQDLSSGTFM